MRLLVYSHDTFGLGNIRRMLAICEYLHESMALDSELNKYAGGEWDYQLEIESVDATESPPRLTLDGALKTHSVFSFLTGEVRLPFSISSVNTRTEGGSE